MLDVSRIEAGMVAAAATRCDLGDVVRDVVTELRAARRRRSARRVVIDVRAHPAARRRRPRQAPPDRGQPGLRTRSATRPSGGRSVTVDDAPDERTPGVGAPARPGQRRRHRRASSPADLRAVPPRRHAKHHTSAARTPPGSGSTSRAVSSSSTAASSPSTPRKSGFTEFTVLLPLKNPLRRRGPCPCTCTFHEYEHVSTRRTASD